MNFHPNLEGDDRVIREEIDTFWKWFSTNESVLLRSIAESPVGDEIDSRLARVSPTLGWEFGPVSQSEKMYFAISPNFDRSRLRLAHKVYVSAYQSELWDFKLGRQAKPAFDFIDFYLPSLSEVRIFDFSEFTFSISDQNSSGNMSIAFQGHFSVPVCYSDAVELCELLLINAVGELIAISKFESVQYGDTALEKYGVQRLPEVVRKMLLARSAG